MADAITTLVNLGPGLVNLATSLIGETDTAKRNAQLIDFQKAIIQLQSLIATVQADNAALVRQKGDLEKQLESMKAWETEKQRYVLARPYHGVTVYALKKSMSNGQAAHYICANCYQDGRPSILQTSQTKEGMWAVICQRPACKASALTGHRMPPAPQYAEE